MGARDHEYLKEHAMICTVVFICKNVDCFFGFETETHCSPGWPEMHYVAEDSFWLQILRSPPSECQS